MSADPSRAIRLALLLLLAPIGLSQPNECLHGDEPVLGLSADPRLAPVDILYRLPDDFVPADLVSLRSVGLPDDRYLSRPAADALARLFQAARDAGFHLEVQSAYRSYEYQEDVFTGWVEVLGRERALATSARPGHSEHQLGTAVDLRGAGGPAPWDVADWAATPEGAWVALNAPRFGFVMSYPAGSRALTCYDYEPWHYRWIGEEDAQAVRESGLTLREWLWREARGAGR